MDVFSSAYPDTCSNIGILARRGAAQQLEALLDGGADYTVKDNRGWYPMHEAAHAGHDTCVELILAAAVKECELNELLLYVFPPAFDGATPLSLAAENKHAKVVKILAPYYRNVPPQNTGYPLHKACSVSDVECLKILTEALPNLINSQEALSGLFPLHVAVEKNDLDSTKLLLQHGASPNVKDFDDCLTPLHTSVMNGNFEIAKLLINFSCHVNATDSTNCTALYLASQWGKSEIASLLLENNADPCLGMTLYPDFTFAGSEIDCSLPLTAAAEGGHLKVLEKLVSVTPKISSTCLAVILAAANGKSDCLKLLLSSGYPTFTILQENQRALAWDAILSGGNPDTIAECVTILINHKTSFHEITKRRDIMSLNAGRTSQVDVYVTPGILLVFLEAGLAEMQQGFCVFPKHVRADVICFEEIHRNHFSNNISESASSLFFDALRKYLRFFPFVSEAKVGVLGAPNAEKPRFLASRVPKLSELCRWYLRCTLVRKYGLINAENIEILGLPRLVSNYLLYR